MRLAFLLGKTRSELLSGLTGARELGEMIAYMNVEPPNKAADQRAAELMAAVYNAPGIRKKAVKAADFLPKVISRKMSIEQEIAQFKSAGDFLGAK